MPAAAAESALVPESGPTAPESATLNVSGLTAAGSSPVAYHPLGASQLLRADTAPQSSQFIRGGATAVGYNLHGIVMGRVPIEGS